MHKTILIPCIRLPCNIFFALRFYWRNTTLCHFQEIELLNSCDILRNYLFSGNTKLTNRKTVKWPNENWELEKGGFIWRGSGISSPPRKFELFESHDKLYLNIIYQWVYHVSSLKCTFQHFPPFSLPNTKTFSQVVEHLSSIPLLFKRPRSVYSLGWEKKQTHSILSFPGNYDHVPWKLIKLHRSQQSTCLSPFKKFIQKPKKKNANKEDHRTFVDCLNTRSHLSYWTIFSQRLIYKPTKKTLYVLLQQSVGKFNPSVSTILLFLCTPKIEYWEKIHH